MRCMVELAIILNFKQMVADVRVDEQNLQMCNDGDVIVVVRWLECTVYVSNK